MAKVKYIDPPNGWSYGFPKVIPEEITEEEVPEWLLKNGYPKAEIDNGGLRYRTWVEETDPAVIELENKALLERYNQSQKHSRSSWKDPIEKFNSKYPELVNVLVWKPQKDNGGSSIDAAGIPTHTPLEVLFDGRYYLRRHWGDGTVTFILLEED